jgi:CheY-like chemotaxis protein
MRVLIADDEPLSRRFVRRCLERRGHVVEEAADGAAVLVRLAATPPLPDAVVLDGMMPVLDGLGTLRRLRADPATNALPVLMLTGQRRRPSAEVEAGGGFAWLSKPFQPHELLQALEHLVATRKEPPDGEG